MKNKITSMEMDDGHILARPQSPAPLRPAPSSGISWVASSSWDVNRTIVGCFSCRQPLYVIYTPIELKAGVSEFQKPPLSLVKGWKVPKNPDEDCPICGLKFARANMKLNSVRYLTDKGLY